MKPVDVHIVHVFTDKEGEFGSPTGIVVDEQRELSPERRQEITKQLGFSETVFINNLDKCDVSIFALQNEIPFAGAPLVGTAWYIGKLKGSLIPNVTCQGNDTQILHEDDLTWIVTDKLSTLPAWNLLELTDQNEVDNLLPTDERVQEHTIAWAWVDKGLKVGKVRARTFAPDWGIIEEEANGSGSMLLAHQLGRNLLIKHGRGSYVRAAAGSTGVAVGGTVVEAKGQKI